MPNPWKKPPQPSAGLSRLVSGLRHDGGGSSLVVQTGFPTSLADLVVKNRDRLKKPSRRKKRSSDLGSSSDDAANAAASPASDFGHSPPPPPPREDRRCRPPAPVVAVNVALRRADCVPRPASAAAGPTERRGFGFWLGLFVVNLFVLAVPAMDRRKVAAGFTLAAFGLWILDIIGVRVFRFVPCGNATRSPELASGGMDLERTALVSPIREVGNDRLVSPIREVGNQDRSFFCSIVASERSKRSSDLVQSSEQSKSFSNLIGESKWSKSCPDLLMESEQTAVDSVYLNQEKKVSSKRRDLGAFAKVCIARLAGSSRNSKAKKLFGKFLPKKLRRKMNGNDVNAFALDLNSREFSNFITEQEEEPIDGDETTAISTESTDDVMSFIASDSVSICDVENMEVVCESARGAKCISSQHLACFAIILLGLLGGKTFALVLTVVLFLFGKSMESLWKKKMDSVV